MKKQKTLKNKRFYMTYLNEKGDEITLSFRSQQSMNEHLQRNKISESNITYRGVKRPFNPDTAGQLFTPKNYLGFNGTSKRGVANG